MPYFKRANQPIDDFTASYIECALWSSDEYDVKLIGVGDHELSEQAFAEMIAEAADFQRSEARLLAEWYELGETPARAGHDFWLTRVGHGAGFWDRHHDNAPAEKLGNQLTAASKAYGSRELYIGYDGLIYQG